MTKVYLCKGEEQSTIRCRGHATGSPEVCSAVSMLVYTMINDLEVLQVPREIKIANGYADITFNRNEKTDTLYDFMKLGFNMLHESYREFVQVNDVNK